MTLSHAVRHVAVRSLVAALWLLVLALPATASAAARATDAPYAPAVSGHVVKAGVSGFEPDFDIIDRVIIAATLRDGRAGLPDSTLVLSTYLENFKPDTTPVLPDLLHPNQTATNLGGFMQGKAVLALGHNHIAYSGSLLAEVFLDNSVHLIVDLYRAGAPDSEPAVRLKGQFTLHKDLSLAGALAATRALTPPQVTALHGPRDGVVSWQSVVQGLSVSLPPMMGTAGSGQKPAAPDTRARNDVLGAITSTHRRPAAVAAAPAHQAPAQKPLQPPSLRQIALGVAVLLALVALLLWIWPNLGRARRPASVPRAGLDQAADAPRAEDTGDEQTPLTADR